MSCVVFKTEGLLDLKSITTFGINVKPKTDNPIGYFGTGLKYAVAVLVRNQIPTRLFIGTEEYEFFVKDIEFREKGFGQVMYRKRKSIVRRWSYTTLPFTTELGKNWELWQAFRELESNTRDEQGQSYHDTAPAEMHVGEEGYTKWVIGGKFAEVFFERDKIFLPKGLTVRDSTSGIHVFNQPSRHLYYRGLRVADLELPTIYTYNLLREQQLTEDRTLKYMWSANTAIAEHVTQSKDPVFIASILDSTDKFYESKLDFDSLWQTPGETFLEIARKKSKRGKILPRAATYIRRYDPPVPPRPKRDNEPLTDRIQWWIDSGEIDGYPELVELLRDEVIPALKGKPATTPTAVVDEIPF